MMFIFVIHMTTECLGVNIEIRRGERIGLIGSTGSGKSTLVDLLMGLLPPSDGTTRRWY